MRGRDALRGWAARTRRAHVVSSYYTLLPATTGGTPNHVGGVLLMKMTGIEKLNTVMNKGMQTPAMIRHFVNNGLAPATATPAEFRALTHQTCTFGAS